MPFIMFYFNLAIWIYAAKAFKHTVAKEIITLINHTMHFAAGLNRDDFQETARNV